jgi:hypothetical protein
VDEIRAWEKEKRMDMRPFRTIPEEVRRQLEQFDTCTISNAVEQFHVRTRNEGFV